MNKIIKVGDSEWVNLHQAADLPAGTAIRVTNQGTTAARIYQGPEAPTEMPAGEILSTYERPYASATVVGPGSCFAKSTRGEAVISVQEAL